MPTGGSKPARPVRVALLLVLVGLLVPLAVGAASAGTDDPAAGTVEQFGFVGGDQPGWVSVDRGSPYDPDRGWGFSSGRTFSVRLPPAVYDVSISVDRRQWGQSRPMPVSAESITTLATRQRQFARTTTTEFPIALIDGRLDLTVADRSALTSIVITREPTRSPGKVPTLFLVGDSTVQTYTDADAPLTGWGQLITRYLDPASVRVANHAMYGRSTKTFVEEGRLDTVLRESRPGDYVAVQLGHNDAFTRPERHTSVATYTANLTTYVRAIRQREATPILITPMVMRQATFGGVARSFPAYVAAMKQVAADQHVTLVDLNAASHDLVSDMGVGAAEALYLHADAGHYVRYETGVSDDVHFNPLGAAEMARLVARGLAGTGLPIAAAVGNTEDSGAVLSEPRGLRVVGLEFGSLRLSWSPLVGADAYRVWARDETEGDRHFSLVRSVPGSDASVLGLITGHRYTIAVTGVAVAHDEVVESARSTPVRFDPTDARWSPAVAQVGSAPPDGRTAGDNEAGKTDPTSGR